MMKRLAIALLMLVGQTYFIEAAEQQSTCTPTYRRLQGKKTKIGRVVFDNYEQAHEEYVRLQPFVEKPNYQAEHWFAIAQHLTETKDPNDKTSLAHMTNAYNNLLRQFEKSSVLK